MSRRTVAVVMLASLTLAGSGCATVLPSARRTLSERCMQPPPDVLEVSMDLHVYENRESQAGARFGRGASCGCS